MLGMGPLKTTIHFRKKKKKKTPHFQGEFLIHCGK